MEMIASGGLVVNLFLKLDGVHDLSEEENQSCGGTVSSGAFVRGARGCLVPRVVHCMRD